MSLSDRRVHGRYPGMEIVRYDRAGKWYLEPTDRRLKRQHVRIGEAIRSALWGLSQGGSVDYAMPGGDAFVRGVREALQGSDRGQR